VVYRHTVEAFAGGRGEGGRTSIVTAKPADNPTQRLLLNLSRLKHSCSCGDSCPLRCVSIA